MKIKTRNRLIVLLLSVLVAFTGITLGLTLTSVNGQTIEGEMVTFTEIKDAYYLNDTFTVDGAKIKVDGQDYDAKSITLRYPDGAIKQGDTYVLDTVGDYLLQFEGQNGEDKLYCEKDITVYNTLFTVPSNSIGEYQEQLSTFSAEKSGINIQLSPSTQFVYNKVINIKDASSKSAPIMSFLPYQYSKEKANTSVTSFNGTTVYPAVKTQAKRFYIRLTDCYDSANFVEIMVRECEFHSGLPSYYYPSFSARSSTQEFRSLTAPSESMKKYGELVNIDGVQYICKNSTYAFSYVWANLKDNGEISVYYDYEKSRFYAKHPGPGADVNLFFADLRIDSVFGDNVFKGFTTGEVYLSVYADEYLTDKACMDITEIYGDRGSDLASDKVVDTTKPQVDVQVPDVNKTYFVAHEREIEIPDAIAYDANLLSVSKKVYYAYGTAQQSAVNVIDNKFKASRLGEYVIEYVATDLYGNKSDPEILRLNSVDTDNGSVINFDVNNLSTNVEAGAKNTMPSVNISGLNGDVWVKSYYYEKANPTLKVEFTAGDQIVFDKLGEYVIAYEYGELFENNVYTYTVNSVTSDKVVFSSFALPKYFIYNASYTLDRVSSYAFTNNVKHLVEESYMVKEDDGEYVSVDWNNYHVQATETVQFKCIAQAEAIESEKIKVVDVGYDTDEYAYTLDMSKYFVGDVTGAKTLSGIELTSTVSNGDATIDFVKEVSISNFQFALRGVAESGNFTAVEVELTDFYNRENKVVLGFKYAEGISAFYTGNASITINSNYFDTNLSVLYDSSNKCFTESTGGKIEWENNFSSDKAFMKITIKGITGDSKIVVKDICKQMIGDSERDFYSSFISNKSNYAGTAEINSKAIIYPAYAVDVLSPFNINGMKVEVTDNTGAYVTAEGGVKLDGTVLADKEYVINLNSYGKYFVKYSYKDAYGNPSSSSYSIFVVDSGTPTIKLDDGLNKDSVVHVKLNEEYKISGYTVSDNLGNNGLTVGVYAIKDETYIYNITENKITFTVKGEYEIYYYCYDAAGNYATASYFVVVE